MALLLQIVFAFMRVSVIAFGGAYAAIPLVENEAVAVQGWMTYEQFADLIALDEITPGPIIINSATFVGMRVAGIPGAIAASLGAILIPCTLVMVLFRLYSRFKGSPIMDSVMVSLKCMAIVLIASTFVRLAMAALLPEGQSPNIVRGCYSIVVMVAAFHLIHNRRLSPLPIMLGCGAVNLVACMLVPTLMP